ncbi:peptidoglycan-binding protein LysM [Alysiella crassa]|uniref:Potassium binding protein Kbp n=1 Tax=Alysiella crassa TaxID=153491 RepID=A0A376BVW7_9NEIS|nr:peptidoglycan-binding protein LysM [Alysiella crassa]UOP06030.1 peptidoglycan-binding protein LysM [Alysiella crassa]SSY80484.1 LysM domain/BON superfamily protein [Alysiella crassa]
MGIFDFAKEIGDKIFNRTEEPVAPTEPAAQEIANQLLARIQENATIAGLTVNYNGDTDTVEITGTAASQAEREKAILAAGNVQHVAKVIDHITVQEPAPESRMYTVKSGDTLSKIAKEMYGNANEYNKIFEANRPLLSHPDKIYPGQVLRIPD